MMSPSLFIKDEFERKDDFLIEDQNNFFSTFLIIVITCLSENQYPYSLNFSRNHFCSSKNIPVVNKKKKRKLAE